MIYMIYIIMMISKKNNNRNTKKIESNKKNENFKKDLINIPESFKDKIKESKN